MPLPDHHAFQDFDHLVQHLRQQVDRRGLGRLTVARALGAAGAWSMLEEADAKKKKKKKKGKKKKSTTTPAPTTAIPTTAGPTTSTTTTAAPTDVEYVFAEDIGKPARFVPSAFNNPSGIGTDGAGNVYVLDRYRFLISRFDAEGENGVSFGEPGAGDGEFEAPFALGVDHSGRTFVGDWFYPDDDDSYQRIEVFSATGEPEGYLADPGNTISGVNSIAVRSDGQIFAAIQVETALTPRIYEWDSTHALVHVWDDMLASNIGIDSAGRLYAWHSSTGVVTVYDTTDDFAEITSFGGSGSGDGQFAWVRGIAADDADNVFVLDDSLCRVQQFTWTGPTSVTYVAQFGSDGSGEQHLHEPSAVASGNGKVYIADSGNRRVQQLSGALVAENQWAAQPGEYLGPSEVVQDADGNFYVVDSEGHRIHKLNSNGQAIDQWGGVQGGAPGQFSYPFGIALSQSGDLYISDQVNRRVQILNTNGVYEREFTHSQFLGSIGSIAFDVDSNLYVVVPDAGRVEKYDQGENYVTGWDGSGPNGRAFVYPVSITVHGDRVYVVDYDDNAVKVFNLAGIPQLIIEVPEPGGVAADDAGRVLVSSMADSQIHVFSASGLELSSFGDIGQEPGQLDSPGFLRFTESGNLLIVDSFNGVMRFTPTTGRASRRSGGGNGKQANAKQKQKQRKRKEHKARHGRDKHRTQRSNNPHGRERHADRRQHRGRDRHD